MHLCVSIFPTITVSDFIGELKGSSSHDANQKLANKVLQWQSGYGVVSFGTGDLPWVKEYVRNQKERHGSGEIVDRLERITHSEDDAKAERREAP